jgi:hypothetical protein
MEVVNWKYFLGACTLAGGLLLKSGAPLAAVGMGIAAAAFVNWRSRHRVR